MKWIEMRMKASAKLARTPIAIDIGRSTIKAVQLRPTRQGSELRNAIILPRRAGSTLLDEPELQRLRGVLERSGFAGSEIVLAVPDGDLLSSILELPPRAPNVPMDTIARMEFARVHKCDPAGLELSYWDLPEAARAAKGTSVMAVGYAHATADPYLDLLESAGLNVVAVDTAASALSRACLPLLSEHGSTAVLDIGAGDARLVLIADKKVTYERSVADGGLAKLSDKLSERLDLDAEQTQYVLGEAGLGERGDRRGAEALATARQGIVAHFAALLSDLQMTFAYAEQRYPDLPVSRLLLCGGGALIPGVAAHMAAVLGLDVRCVACSDLVECEEHATDRSSPLLTKAIGLAQFPGL